MTKKEMTKKGRTTRELHNIAEQLRMLEGEVMDSADPIEATCIVVNKLREAIEALRDYAPKEDDLGEIQNSINRILIYSRDIPPFIKINASCKEHNVARLR